MHLKRSRRMDLADDTVSRAREGKEVFAFASQDLADPDMAAPGSPSGS
jgi:hypothetical protein